MSVDKPRRQPGLHRQIVRVRREDPNSSHIVRIMNVWRLPDITKKGRANHLLTCFNEELGRDIEVDTLYFGCP